MPQQNTYQTGGYGMNNQYQQQQYQHPPNTNTNITMIQGGIAGANVYPVQPGCAMALWDSERNTFYVKVVDAAGIPQPIRVFDYKERVETQEETENKGYVTEERLNEILDEKFASFAQSMKQNNKQRYSNQKGGKQNGKSTI